MTLVHTMYIICSLNFVNTFRKYIFIQNITYSLDLEQPTQEDCIKTWEG